MLDSLVALAATANPPPTVPGLGIPYPWGASAADELFVLGAIHIANKWLDYHYDGERREFIDALQPES